MYIVCMSDRYLCVVVCVCVHPPQHTHMNMCYLKCKLNISCKDNLIKAAY